jgi:hypothetical protein
LHLRRFLWREESTDVWKVYSYTRAHFGDLSAGFLLEIAKRKVAEQGRFIDPLAAEQLLESSYVDDGVMGGSPEDMDRMQGKKTEGGWDGTVGQILKLGGMEAKFMARSGTEDSEAEELLGGKFLGTLYLLREDVIAYDLKPSMPLVSAPKAFAQIIDKGRVGRMKSGTEILTRRKLLSMIMGIHDPLGLISPIVIGEKILLQSFCGGEKKLGWDEKLEPEKSQEWVHWMEECLHREEMRFPRATRPPGAIGEPSLMGFADASASEMCIAVYVLWKMANDRVKVRILLGKCRVIPLKGSTISRRKLQALCMLLRAMLWILKESRIRWNQVGSVTDSECTITALRKSGEALKIFFANRVMECQNTLQKMKEFCKEVVPVRHVPGKLNPADVGTICLAKRKEIGIGSLWQGGPSFLLEEQELWPRIKKPVERCLEKSVRQPKYPQSAASQGSKVHGQRSLVM